MSNLKELQNLETKESRVKKTFEDDVAKIEKLFPGTITELTKIYQERFGSELQKLAEKQNMPTEDITRLSVVGQINDCARFKMGNYDYSEIEAIRSAILDIKWRIENGEIPKPPAPPVLKPITIKPKPRRKESGKSDAYVGKEPWWADI